MNTPPPPKTQPQNNNTNNKKRVRCKSHEFKCWSHENVFFVGKSLVCVWCLCACLFSINYATGALLYPMPNTMSLFSKICLCWTTCRLSYGSLHNELLLYPLVEVPLPWLRLAHYWLRYMPVCKLLHNFQLLMSNGFLGHIMITSCLINF